MWGYRNYFYRPCLSQAPNQELFSGQTRTLNTVTYGCSRDYFSIVIGTIFDMLHSKVNAN